MSPKRNNYGVRPFDASMSRLPSGTVRLSIPDQLLDRLKLLGLRLETTIISVAQKRGSGVGRESFRSTILWILDCECKLPSVGQRFKKRLPTPFLRLVRRR